MAYYNFIKQIKDLYEIMDATETKYHPTLRLMIDEVMYHFMDSYKVPFEKQGEFLLVMFPDCPRAQAEYKTKKFSM